MISLTKYAGTLQRGHIAQRTLIDAALNDTIHDDTGIPRIHDLFRNIHRPDVARIHVCWLN